MTNKVCPPLGSGSVDFNALHEAIIKAEPAEKTKPAPAPTSKSAG